MAPQHILIIDDSLTNLKLIRVLLESEGYVTTTATDAVSALQRLLYERPDLILTDLQMPSMDGLALARLLKSDPRYKGIPIVALTAYAMKGDEERALAAGCDGYLTKPIDTRLFAQTIAGLLDRHAARSKDETN